MIKSRFNSFKDLELIICATKALERLGFKKIHLFVPYLLGARSDRQFQEGGNSYLVDVIAPIINAQNFESVTVIDVHSDVAAACINNLHSISNLELVQFAIDDLFTYKDLKDRNVFNTDKLNWSFLISPDGGSLKKIYKVAESIGFTGDIITCSKSRDENGKLTKTVVPISTQDVYSSQDYIIIDDICDGGRTFINIAIEIRKEQERHNQLTNARGKIYLIVTHGIFSAGFNELNKYFDCIYCTNSVKNIAEVEGNDLIKTNVKQLNVF
jgi:ribose-phosphate pyrophosphokinase